MESLDRSTISIDRLPLKKRRPLPVIAVSDASRPPSSNSISSLSTSSLSSSMVVSPRGGKTLAESNPRAASPPKKRRPKPNIADQDTTAVTDSEGVSQQQEYEHPNKADVESAPRKCRGNEPLAAGERKKNPGEKASRRKSRQETEKAETTAVSSILTMSRRASSTRGGFKADECNALLLDEAITDDGVKWRLNELAWLKYQMLPHWPVQVKRLRLMPDGGTLALVAFFGGRPEEVEVDMHNLKKYEADMHKYYHVRITDFYTECVLRSADAWMRQEGYSEADLCKQCRISLLDFQAFLAEHAEFCWEHGLFPESHVQQD